ncbi:hypothetical protein BDD12DRAFT_808875 [Trichophaea hybrida]|nr:hypothetical protein BDD12DRAFT_808875 [Trichophaea hybrida]
MADLRSANNWPAVTEPKYRQLVDSLPFIEIYRRLRNDLQDTNHRSAKVLAASNAVVQKSQAITHLPSRVDDKENQLQKANRTIAGLQPRLNEKNGEIQQLKNNVTHHKNELRISQDRGHRANSTNRSLRKQLDEKNQEILKLEDTLEAKFLPSYLFFSRLTNNYSIAMSTVASVEAVV